MPSAQHETPVAVIRTNPDLLGWLLGSGFERKVPDFEHVRPHATDVRVMVPRTYHADGMVVFCDAADRPLMGAVLEVQRRWDVTKLRTWKLYVAQLEAELDVATSLVVFCPDPAIARRYRALFEEDESSLTLLPLIFTPDDLPLVTDVALARANPAQAVFTAVCHIDRPEVEAAFPALVEALRAADPKQALLYYDVVLAGLPPATRTRWEAFMSTAAGYEFQSELLRQVSAEHEARGEARGEAHGEAQAILTVLEERGVPVSDDIRDQIMTCADTSQLTTWLRRAVTAATAEDVVRA